MVKSLILITIFFYLITLIQSSFLVYFPIFGMIFNLNLIFVFLINLFENPKKNLGLQSAVISGFFWDIFSSWPIGVGISILFLLAFFTKLIFRKYVRISFIR